MKKKRRTMNRFTTLFRMVLATVSVGLLISASWGQQYPGGQMYPGGAQGTANRAATPKAQAMQFLSQGRAALQKGNLEEAAHYAKQADLLVAEYGQNEDSPERLWNDIQIANRTQRGLVEAPVSPAVGVAAGSIRPGTAPNSGAPYNGAYGGSAQYPGPQPNTGYPPGQGGYPSGPTAQPGGYPPPASAGMGNPRAGAPQPSAQEVGRRSRMIVDARVALSKGDVRTAMDIAYQAGQMPFPYPPNQDTHDMVLQHAKNFSAAMQRYHTEGDTEGVRRGLAKSYLEQSQMLLGWGRLDEAAELAYHADRLNVKYNHLETKPRDILSRIEAVRKQRGPNRLSSTGVDGEAEIAVAEISPQTGNEVVQASAEGAGRSIVAPAIFNPSGDTNRAMPVNIGGPGQTLIQSADTALKQGNRDEAKKYLAEAEQYRSGLDPASAKRLSDLQLLLSHPDSGAPITVGRSPDEPRLMNPESDTVLFNQLATEMENRARKARELRSTDPVGALKLLTDARETVKTSALPDNQRDMLIRSLDKKIEEYQKFIDENLTDIEFSQRNKLAQEAINREYQAKASKNSTLTEMTEKFNRLLDDHRYAEAALVGKMAKEMYPDEPVAVQLEHTGRTLWRDWESRTVREDKATGYLDALHAVDRSSVAPSRDYEFRKDWKEFSTKRLERYREENHLSEAELEIKKLLDTPIQPNFSKMPLRSVIDFISQATGVNIILDPAGLAEEGVSPSDPVSLETQKAIKLENALKLILEPLKLDYTIRNEVLYITSKGRKDTGVYMKAYPVADLVIPIPNFSPSSSTGLEGALRNALSATRGDIPPWVMNMMAPSVAMAQRAGADTSAIPQALLAQTNVPVGGNGGARPVGPGVPIDSASGGAASADFDSLITLITTTIAKDTWDAVGGPGTIAAFPGNLSLVVSQTQEIHESIANLLEQLRRLQDLQVTIEVRFITLSDTFFEKIGVDLNMNIPTKSAGAFTASSGGDGTSVLIPNGRSATVGQGGYYDGSVTPSSIGFLQSSAALTTAGAIIGGYDPTKNFGAQLGFAILSDVEAYLFMEAAQSTERSSILQAPKVTLFNGQQAFVSDTSQTPFVISVTPVVGDFAAALQPVIVVLSEGTFMTVQAVVSPDRRFVRLTVVPYFSQIGDVKTFTYSGDQTTIEDTSSIGKQGDEMDENSSNSAKRETRRQGTTVQLPTFSYVTVTTTVSVPDGGTVLLGGIKRLSEGRSEAGVPILNKVPFLNRLFKNTSIGRQTSSLMMVVTPRIIIQEEEEENIGVVSQ